jgi:hypothetical protein
MNNTVLFSSKSVIITFQCTKDQDRWTIILPIVSYGHKMWSLTITEENKLVVQALKSEVMTNIFRFKRTGEGGKSRIIHN